MPCVSHQSGESIPGSTTIVRNLLLPWSIMQLEDKLNCWKLHKVAFLAKWDYLQLCLYSCMYDMNPVWVENIGSAVCQFWLITSHSLGAAAASFGLEACRAATGVSLWTLTSAVTRDQIVPTLNCVRVRGSIATMQKVIVAPGSISQRRWTTECTYGGQRSICPSYKYLCLKILLLSQHVRKYPPVLLRSISSSPPLILLLLFFLCSK